MNFRFDKFDKLRFSIFHVSRDRERCLTASVRDFTLCGILLGYFLSITAALVRDPQHSHDLFRAEM